jgi:deoxyribodipyrimidine photo-lyase
MQRAQRTRFNHALDYAIERANAAALPVVVGFGLTDRFPEANERHYAFMLDGLRDVAERLAQRNIAFVLRRGEPPDVAIGLARRAALVVTDRGYLRIEKAWRRAVVDAVAAPVHEVETDAVVPVRLASAKQEVAARTLRPKVHRLLDDFLHAPNSRGVRVAADGLRLPSDLDAKDPAAVLRRLHVDPAVGRVARFKGGEVEAGRHLRSFIERRFADYAEKRSEPALGNTSLLSPYLHFGQISPLEIALAARSSAVTGDSRAGFLEELIVRRELALNFVEHQEHYDRYDALPSWARATLAKHKADPRPTLYTEAELVAAETADPYWNAAMDEMRLTGFMHNTMRMYWGKKILEWSPDAEEAWRRTLRLNNRYFVDGRDVNSFANVGWIFGLHDRPWAERPIFGTVRYMNARGLERKFDIGAYVDWVRALEEP